MNGSCLQGFEIPYYCASAAMYGSRALSSPPAAPLAQEALRAVARGPAAPAGMPAEGLAARFKSRRRLPNERPEP